MTIPFTKAHGAGNDFVLTWAADSPPADLAETARAICDRHTGVGADGWLLFSFLWHHLGLRSAIPQGPESQRTARVQHT